MKFSNFMNDLFSKMEQKPQMRPVHFGRPRNVGQGGQVARHPGVVVARNVRQHVTKEGKACSNVVKFEKGPNRPMATMIHRAVPVEVFKDRKQAVARKAIGRYVW